MLRCANVLGPDVDTSFTRMFSLPLVPMMLGFDPRSSSSTRTTSCTRSSTPRLHRAPGHLQRRRRRRARALRGRSACSASAPLPVLPPWGTGLRRGAAAAARVPHPRRDAQPAALRPRGRQPHAQGDRLRLRLHDARDRAQARRAPAAAPGPARAPSASLPLRARGRGVPALEPARAARARRRARAASAADREPLGI